MFSIPGGLIFVTESVSSVTDYSFVLIMESDSTPGYL